MATKEETAASASKKWKAIWATFVLRPLAVKFVENVVVKLNMLGFKRNAATLLS